MIDKIFYSLGNMIMSLNLGIGKRNCPRPAKTLLSIFNLLRIMPKK